MDWTPEELQQIVDDHPIVLFMKGSPNEPRCGFSNRAAQVVSQFASEVETNFASVDVLSDRRAIPSVCAWSDFPTMPQVFIHGELIGEATSRWRCTKMAVSVRCSTKAALHDHHTRLTSVH